MLVNVYRDLDLEAGEVVARVKYNEDLDMWDGNNRTNGGFGRHKGIAKLENGEYVIIYGTQWDGEVDYGLIVSEEEALQEILKSRNDELLEDQRFKELKEVYEATLLKEEE